MFCFLSGQILRSVSSSADVTFFFGKICLLLFHLFAETSLETSSFHFFAHVLWKRICDLSTFLLGMKKLNFRHGIIVLIKENKNISLFWVLVNAETTNTRTTISIFLFTHHNRENLDLLFTPVPFVIASLHLNFKKKAWEMRLGRFRVELVFCRSD